MYDSIYDVSKESICIEVISIFLLLFADDTVLFSYTKEGLQSLLYKLHKYCDKWGISVNLDKTVVMVCNGMQKCRKCWIDIWQPCFKTG